MRFLLHTLIYTEAAVIASVQLAIHIQKSSWRLVRLAAGYAWIAALVIQQALYLEIHIDGGI